MSKKKKLTLAEVKSILEYNKTMLTCDMSVSRDPEHQDVSPDYYGKDAEDLYYAIVFIEKYLDNSIPIEWINSYTTGLIFSDDYEDNADSIDYYIDCIKEMVRDWEKENETKTGYWIKDNIVLTSYPPQYQWHCSECGETVHGFSDEVLKDRCPNCGIKMEKENGSRMDNR